MTDIELKVGTLVGYVISNKTVILHTAKKNYCWAVK